MTSDKTHVCVLTPPGTAAIATLALVGPRAWDVARELFKPVAEGATLPERPPLDRVWHGQFGGPTGDVVVLTAKRWEPVPWVELHCHGGSAVVRWVAELLTQQGLTIADWPAARRQVGESSLSTLAAVELTRAPTRRTAAILLDQCHGALEHAIQDTIRLIVSGQVEAARQRLDELRRFASLGRHLTRPWRVAVAGAPNVGKSSLVNALAGYQRTVVTAVPGTTRDLVTTALAIDGWPVELIDTAGQHESADELEVQGIARARAASADADLCLWVVAASAPPDWPTVGLREVLFVINKVDRPAEWDVTARPDAVRVSALTGSGLDILCDRISQRLVPVVPSPGAALPFTPDLAADVECCANRFVEEMSAEVLVWLRELVAASSCST
jgi:tRNA modification GTPase